MTVIFDGFAPRTLEMSETSIFVQEGGGGPPLLLLHGFPQTHLMWRDIAPRLARNFRVIAADLRGYGRSGAPPTTPDHSPYSKRTLAKDMLSVMRQLGFERFALAGHDRGGRVAYRLALDHPDAVTHLAVLDIVPTSTAWTHADARLALSFWPWSFLAQPAPLPERLLTLAADSVIEDAITNWGSNAQAFPAAIRSAYAEALRDPAHAHGICEDYRAATTLDREHDEADQMAGRRIRCPMLVLWSAAGGLNTWYAEFGGPLALWRTLADRVEGAAVPGGHFFPEDYPEDTAKRLAQFFSESGS
jgi:haloacetate dehalogenase